MNNWKKKTLKFFKNTLFFMEKLKKKISLKNCEKLIIIFFFEKINKKSIFLYLKNLKNLIKHEKFHTRI